MDLQSQGRRDPSGGSLANSCPWASSGQGARKVCVAGTRPLAWKDLDRRTVPHAAPSSRGQQLSSRYQSKCSGPPTATAPVAGAGGSPSVAIFAPGPPYCDSPWSRRAAGGVI